MNKTLEEYLAFRSLEVSKSTLKRLEYQLKAFKNFLNLEHWNELESEDLNRYLAFKKKTCNEITLNCIHCSLTGFVEWLYKRGFYLSQLNKEKSQRRAEYLPRFTPSQELTKELFEKANLGQKFPLRNKAILELVYSSGLRRGEVRALNMGDVSGDFLHIIGKGNKERMVPFGDRAKAAVLEYLSQERPLLVKNKSERALFISQTGRRLSPGSYSQVIVPKSLHKALTMHSFRHACATHMLENGASIVHLKEMLGHEKLSTTQVYTRLSVKDLQKVLEKYHPRG